MARVAVFSGPSLKRNLEPTASRELVYDFFSLAVLGRNAPDLRSFDGALVELGARTGGAAIRILRRSMAEKPVGSVCAKTDPATLKRSMTLGFDFHLTSAGRGTPTAG